MHYTELLRGVNAYHTEGENKDPSFPNSPYQLDPEDDKFDIRYLDTVDEVRKAGVDYRRISKAMVPFLKSSRIRVRINETELTKAYQSVFQQVHHWKLEEISLRQFKDEIMQIFSRFSNVVRFTGASKALHVFNPDFFMMWDVKIRQGYGLHHDEEGYFNLLLRSQEDLQEIVQTYIKDHGVGRISQRIYQGRLRSEVKLLDEYNFAKYTRNWI